MVFFFANENTKKVVKLGESLKNVMETQVLDVIMN